MKRLNLNAHTVFGYRKYTALEHGSELHGTSDTFNIPNIMLENMF